MTALAERKTQLKFETSATVRGKRLVIEASPYLATIRQKYTRQRRYEVSWEGIFLLAVKAQVDSKKRRADRASLIRRR
ncbi:MAG TPA: hypothetical protein VGR97_14850 [Candidatus Acidoferrales bacterium]|nr:hypothetical protein [Candidatus Acidoferrales bacterium]